MQFKAEGQDAIDAAPSGSGTRGSTACFTTSDLKGDKEPSRFRSRQRAPGMNCSTSTCPRSTRRASLRLFALKSWLSYTRMQDSRELRQLHPAPRAHGVDRSPRRMWTITTRSWSSMPACRSTPRATPLSRVDGRQRSAGRELMDLPGLQSRCARDPQAMVRPCLTAMPIGSGTCGEGPSRRSSARTSSLPSNRRSSTTRKPRRSTRTPTSSSSTTRPSLSRRWEDSSAASDDVLIVNGHVPRQDRKKAKPPVKLRRQRRVLHRRQLSAEAYSDRGFSPSS